MNEFERSKALSQRIEELESLWSAAMVIALREIIKNQFTVEEKIEFLCLQNHDLAKYLRGLEK